VKVQVMQVMVDNDPFKTGDKIEAVVSTQYAQGFHLRGITCVTATETTSRGPVDRQIVHLIFVKPER
jgi:hypothetical protein